MPRDGSKIYHRPPGTDGIPDTTIESTKYNINVADVEQDLNLPRPIIAGGTGANNARSAMTNLGGEVAKQSVDNYDSFPFADGDFYSVPGATNAPDGLTSGSYIAGICYGEALSSMVLHARILSGSGIAGAVYTRAKISGVWGAWLRQAGSAADLDASYVNTAGDVMTGQLSLLYSSPTLNLNKPDNSVISILGTTQNKPRWSVSLGNAETETGGNAGSNFGVTRFDDAGNLLDNAIFINRSDCSTYFSGTIHYKMVTGIGAGAYYGSLSGGADYFFWGTDSISNSFRLFSLSAGNNIMVVSPDGNMSITGDFSSRNISASGNISANGTIGAVGNVSGGSISSGNGITVPTQNASFLSSATITTVTMNTNCYLGYTKANGSFVWLVNGTGQADWNYTQQTYSIAGAGFQPGGGPWNAVSDARIKNVLGDYESGLDEILALQPVRYVYKGNDTTAPPVNTLSVPGEEEDKSTPVVPYKNSAHYSVAKSGREYVGLVAQAVEPVMPEMVAAREGYIDGELVPDLLNIDTTPLIYALINAVKTLAARVEELEAQQPARR